MRIGLLVPDVNTTMEQELRESLPQGTELKRLGIPRPHGMMRLQDVPEEEERALRLAATFAGDCVDAVIYGCTAAGFLSGPERDARFTEALRKTTGKPAITTAASTVAALKSAGATQIGLVTPYREQVNAQLEAFLAHDGIRVRSAKGFDKMTVDELVRIGPEAVRSLSREAMREDCDALFIACSQLPTLAILGSLERELDRPVWSSIKATAWNAARTFDL